MLSSTWVSTKLTVLSIRKTFMQWTTGTWSSSNDKKQNQKKKKGVEMGACTTLYITLQRISRHLFLDASSEQTLPRQVRLCMASSRIALHIYIYIKYIIFTLVYSNNRNWSCLCYWYRAPLDIIRLVNLKSKW